MGRKVERQLSIIGELLDYKKHKCKDFANNHGVSVKTIKQDVSELSITFPIITFQGRNGGVSIYDGFVVNGKMLNLTQLKILQNALNDLAKRHFDPEIQSLIEWFSFVDKK